MRDAPNPEETRIRWVSGLLRTGVVLSAIVMIVGLFGLFIAGGDVFDGEIHRTAAELIQSTLGPGAQSTPPYVMMLYAGLVLLMLTPVLRVLTVVVAFFLEKDRAFALISLLVLVMLIAEIVVALR